MARTRRTAELEGATLDRVVAREAAIIIPVIRPYLVLALVTFAGWGVHAAWAGWWTAVAITAAGLTLAGHSWHLTHRRDSLAGRFLSPATVMAATLWLAGVAVTGLGRHSLEWLAIGGGTVTILWSMWLHNREHDDHDTLGAMFRAGGHAETAEIGPVKLISATKIAGKVTGKFRVAPGKVAAHAISRARHWESAAGLAPGTITMNPDEDHAAGVKFTLSDPRVLNKPQPWPGPSAAGASIADPIHLGLWQDGDPVSYVIVNHHCQIMGMSGSGKSFGAAANEIGETITRCDAAIIALDVTKRSQTLGPFAAGLHYLADTEEKARLLLRALHLLVSARTDYLAAQGRQSWEKGCGLTHLTFWLEEFPDIIKLLGDGKDYEDFESDVRAARSAGIRLVFSLQRSDHTQMPTLMRGQLAKWCFGVNSSHDAQFGLSPAQAKADCEPELWADNYPGKFYLDAPGIPAGYRVMAARAYFWGKKADKIAAHAAAYPASARPLDELTLRIITQVLATADPGAASPDAPRKEPAMNPTPSPATRDDYEEGETRSPTFPDTLSDEELAAARQQDLGYDEPEGTVIPPAAEDLRDWKFGRPTSPSRMTPADAAAAFDRQIDAWEAEGRRRFGATDFDQVRQDADRTRSWLYTQFARAEQDGRIVKDDRAFPAAWDIRQRLASVRQLPVRPAAGEN